MKDKSRQTRLLAWLDIFVVAKLLIAGALGTLAAYSLISVTTIRVPQSYQLNHTGINVTRNGDRVFVSPGISHKQLAHSDEIDPLTSSPYLVVDKQFIYETGARVASSTLFEKYSADKIDLWGETPKDFRAISIPGRIHLTSATLTRSLTATPWPTDVLRFAVIGDYGQDWDAEQRVATLVDSWNPDFVVTTGDNNYPRGRASTIDANIGKYYSQFIGNYRGAYGPGSQTNRFWPSIGNHDWLDIRCNGQGCNGAYLNYFTLPGNERYYNEDLGLVHLFAVNSDDAEPHGHASDSVQANWLQDALAASTSCFNVVYFHHPPYSSGEHGSNATMRWPFQAWGADVVLTGHDHHYERIDASGFPYFVNGSGGASLRDFPNIGTLPPEVVSVIRYNQDHGAMLVTASDTGILYQFFNAEGVMIDELSVGKNCGSGPTPTFEYELYLPLALRDSNPLWRIPNMPGVFQMPGM